MNAGIRDLRLSLVELQEAVDNATASVEPFTENGAWNTPGVSKLDLHNEIQSLIDILDLEGSDDQLTDDTDLADLEARVRFLEESTLPNLVGNPQAGLAAFYLTLIAVRAALTKSLKLDPRRELASGLRAVRERIRSADATLSELGPKVQDLASMMTRIEDAYNAADRLPTDLQALSEARQRIDKLAEAATTDRGRAEAAREAAVKIRGELDQILEKANSTMARSEAALSAATSVGLAAAFQERSERLSSSMWTWVVGLICALVAGVWLGVARVQSLAGLLGTEPVSGARITVNVLLTLLSVGGPIWFAWLSTKQIGQRFRLAEDYAFKASISRAYEGYRREAARIDADLEARLLASALDRLDELPLRLVEPASHGSPLHEAMSSELIREAFKVVPDFADKLKGFTATTIAGVSGAAAAVVGTKKPAEEPLQASTSETG